MKITKSRVAIAAVALVLTLAAAGLYMKMNATTVDDAEGDVAEGSDPVETSASDQFSTSLAIAVEGSEVLLDTLVMSVSASGQAASTQQTLIRSQVAGQVRAIRVRENQAVGRSAVLIEIDPTEYQLALDEARANLRRAESLYRGYKIGDDRLTDPEVLASRDSAQRAQANLDGAEVAVKRAEMNLLRTRILAPFGGRVANLKVVPGQYVTAGEELMVVQSMDPVRIQAQVLEAEIGFLQPGRPARVTFSAFPGEVFEGVIETINPIVEQQTRTARVSVTVRNPQGRILPGMFARVELAARRFPDRLLVPHNAVLERDTNRREMLFVHEDGRAKWRYVKTGLRNDLYVEIVEVPEEPDWIVRPGEIVLVAGHHTLTHDAPIRLVENSSTAPGGRPLR
ncbi:MAG TPA: efflux RND transporter periplasmic adaptor subunit [Longimicrobiales bacterium]|nr:efflux RND transporter periplasmic adaptor subunit [Longimicrobiales bacterium]